ncbi:MAG: hypothetical protein IPK16_03830 [Anaerolineales bacterium]|nr:hypothetical protein [Anaerolineales bacterium]
MEQLGSDRLRDGGLRVVTTLDLDLQRQTEAAVDRRLNELTCRHAGACTDPAAKDRRVENAAAVVMDSHTGDILAMVGSPDYFNQTISGNVNAAISPRQPGSAIKPFTYAAALDPAWSARRGQPPLTPASILPDLPYTFQVQDVDGTMSAYRPQNYDREYHGPVSVRTALANSYNIPAVHVLDRIGVETLRELASQAGIRTFTERYGLALTLGGGSVRLLDLTAAYGVFDDGAPVEPRAVLRIDEAKANEEPLSIDNFPISKPSPILSSGAPYLITDILSDDAARIPGFGAHSVLQLPFPAAAKTGTTTDWRDNWTIGYSTDRLVGVWVGNADNSPMQDVSGVDGAGPIWHDLMLLAHEQRPGVFPKPAGIVETEICAPSGMAPGANCPRTRFERFLYGTQPTQPDNQFQRIAVDLATRQQATGDTPANRKTERVFWILPPEYHDWMVSQGIAIAPLGAGAPPPTDQTQPATGPLVLTNPASNTRFQIHPGLRTENQRLELAGYTADGNPWQQLRLVVDGQTVATADTGNRLRTWWNMTMGTHVFWLEGERTPGAPTLRSAPAQVTVDPFKVREVTVSSVQ